MPNDKQEDTYLGSLTEALKTSLKKMIEDLKKLKKDNPSLQEPPSYGYTGEDYGKNDPPHVLALKFLFYDNSPEKLSDRQKTILRGLQRLYHPDHVDESQKQKSEEFVKLLNFVLGFYKDERTAKFVFDFLKDINDQVNNFEPKAEKQKHVDPMKNQHTQDQSKSHNNTTNDTNSKFHRQHEKDHQPQYGKKYQSQQEPSHTKKHKKARKTSNKKHQTPEHTGPQKRDEAFFASPELAAREQQQRIWEQRQANLREQAKRKAFLVREAWKKADMQRAQRIQREEAKFRAHTEEVAGAKSKAEARAEARVRAAAEARARSWKKAQEKRKRNSF